MATSVEIIVGGTWPNAQPHITPALIHSIFSSFRSITSERITDSLIVANHPAIESPLAVYEKTLGKDLIILSISNAALWAQISYQLSHELCHLLANFRENLGHKHKWFEEAVCELASLHNIVNMASEWRVSPPIPFMSYYSKHLDDYVDETIARARKNVPLNDNLHTWLSSKLSFLENEKYSRADNTVVAIKLLPLFLKDKKHWKVVSFLNTWQCQDDETFEHFLKGWKERVPEDYKYCVENFGSILGYDI